MKNPRFDNSLRVLISGHLEPPVGGISTYFKAVMGSTLRDKVQLCFVQSSSQKRSFADSGKASLANIGFAAEDCWRFSKAVFTFHPQVVHIATAFGLSFLKHSLCALIARVAGSKVLIQPHCSFSVLYKDCPATWKWFFRQVMKLTGGILALSSEWLELKRFCPACKVFLLNNAIDLKPYRNIAESRLSNKDHHAITQILYLGHLGSAKGSYLLIEAAKTLQQSRDNFIIHLVGEELTRGELPSLCKAISDTGIGERVQLHSPVFDQEKLEYFRKADIFVYPSYHEGMPIAVIEAMACGLPIVATRVGGLPDLVRHESNGLLISPGQPGELAEALSQLIENTGLRESMQQKSIQFASEHFDIEDHVQNLVQIYHDVLANPARKNSQDSCLEHSERIC